MHAIRVVELCKKFALGQRAGSLRDEASRWLRREKGPDSREFWALRDVTFDVPAGEAVAIIGRNGAGKSTLLKVLSRVTPPTSGRAILEGRTASLLEVGTGFHPELTGRENVFLNGTILGMSLAEVRAKFDAIVDFSGVERFIDTPLKHYSSGMSVRLAFAVAAFLDTEILIVDEVLAVGDAEFQRKCLRKMESVAQEGRTVLFVSHSMETVLNLCSRAILLDQGSVVTSGPVASVVERYLTLGRDSSRSDLAHRTDREGDGSVRFVACGFQSSEGRELQTVLSGQTLVIELRYEARESHGQVLFWLQFLRQGAVVFTCSNHVTSGFFAVDGGPGVVTCRIPRLPLFQGDYSIDLFAMVDGRRADYIRDAVVLRVDSGDFYGSGRLPTERQGVLVEYEWRSQRQATGR